MRSLGWWPLALPLVLAVSGCATGGLDAATGTGVVTGIVSYREAATLPPDAVIEVRVSDISRLDVAPLLAETSVHAGGRQLPQSVELRYEAAKVRRDRAYAVRASVRSGGRLIFATEAASRVITGGNPSRVELRLARIGEAGSSLPAELRGTWWVEDLAGTGSAGRVDATLELADGGKVSGTGSCNRFTGTLTTAGEAISFGPLATTRMACVQEITNFETRYLQALERTEHFVLDGKFLLLYPRDSDKPIRFVRARRQQ